MAQSVRARLLNLARRQQENYNLLLIQYANERFLYRLTQSNHCHRFVLKGAALFKLWLGRTHRPTHDLDLLGYGAIDDNELSMVFRDICEVAVDDDGCVFDSTTIKIADIREGEIYHGKRLSLSSHIGTARVGVFVDIGVGDVTIPEPELKTYPVLLNHPAPRIRMYTRETVVAEKLDAILVLGLRNSRMKDYFDLWTLSSHFDFDGSVLQEAICATLTRRGREHPVDIPIGISDEFAKSAPKKAQWKAFLNRTMPGQVLPELEIIVERIRQFLEPIVVSLNTNKPFAMHWQAKNQLWT